MKYISEYILTSLKFLLLRKNRDVHKKVMVNVYFEEPTFFFNINIVIVKIFPVLDVSEQQISKYVIFFTFL